MADPGSGGVEARPRTPVHFWIVGVLALLWNLMGAFDYTATQLRWEPYLGQFTEEQLAYFTGYPAWMVAFWAIGVWCALLGSIGLLLRKRWAVWMFGLSILGLLVGTIYNFALTEGAEIMGATGAVFTVVIWIVAVFLLLYSRRMAAKGILT